MLTVTLDDDDILDERPVVLTIGPRKKKVVLKLLTISEYFDKFVPKFTSWMLMFRNLIGEMAFLRGAEFKNRKKLEGFRRDIMSLFRTKSLRIAFLRVLKDVGALKMGVRYFEKHATPDQLVKIFLYVYKVNVDGYKKKVQSVVVEILARRSRTSTQLLSGGAGLKPGLHKELKPRFPVLTRSKRRSSSSSSFSGGNGKPNTGRRNERKGNDASRRVSGAAGRG